MSLNANANSGVGCPDDAGKLRIPPFHRKQRGAMFSQDGFARTDTKKRGAGSGIPRWPGGVSLIPVSAACEPAASLLYGAMFVRRLLFVVLIGAPVLAFSHPGHGVSVPHAHGFGEVLVGLVGLFAGCGLARRMVRR